MEYHNDMTYAEKEKLQAEYTMAGTKQMPRIQ